MLKILKENSDLPLTLLHSVKGPIPLRVSHHHLKKTYLLFLHDEASARLSEASGSSQSF